MRRQNILLLLKILTKVLHFLPSELSHKLALEGLKIITFLGFKVRGDSNSLTLLNINFANKLGLAAGLDKNGDYIDSLSAIGFSFLEIGTVTPRPQKGNQKPRLFRIKSQKALINSMGFNNKGVDHLVNKVEKRNSKIPLGISIGKNLDTPIEMALDDYLICLEKVYKLADYVAVNISSPNTKIFENFKLKIL